MNIDNEIFLAKCEKFLESVWNKNCKEIFSIEKNLNESVNILNIKYNKRAESLREYKYVEMINNLLFEKNITPKMALELKSLVEDAYVMINSNNIDTIKAGYSVLSDTYSILESGLLEELSAEDYLEIARRNYEARINMAKGNQSIIDDAKRKYEKDKENISKRFKK